MAKSERTRSTFVPAKMPIASWPLVADTTRYPLVLSKNESTERSCSLSSTQRMIFFGRIWGAHSLFIVKVAWRQYEPYPACAGVGTRSPWPFWPQRRIRLQSAISYAEPRCAVEAFWRTHDKTQATPFNAEPGMVSSPLAELH